MTEINPNMHLQGEDIILVSNQMLEDRYWTSKQYITQELKKQNRVLYVEANYSFGKLALGLLNGSWPVKPFGALVKKSDTLWVLTPLPRLPLRNHLRFMGWLNQLLLKRSIRKAVKKLAFRDPILWTFLHQTADLVSKLGEKFAIYHCVDDWPALLPMAGMGNPTQIMWDENKLLESVDIVFRVSEKLLAGREHNFVPVIDIPNGVDTSLFKPSIKESRKIPQDIEQLPTPIIGFSGSIGAWIDVDLMHSVARRFPQASIVLIGLNEKNPRLANLLQEKNVHFLGMKKREDVPLYLAYFDICMMPFDKGQVGEGLLPLKMFEYLAMGRPIVAISSRIMQDFEDVLFLAEDNDSFLNQVTHALEYGLNKKAIVKRIEKAQEYSWEKRMLNYSSSIKEFSAHISQ